LMVFHHESESGAWLIRTNFASAAVAVGEVIAAAPHNATAAASARSAARPLQNVICLHLFRLSF